MSNTPMSDQKAVETLVAEYNKLENNKSLRAAIHVNSDTEATLKFNFIAFGPYEWKQLRSFISGMIMQHRFSQGKIPVVAG